jgi:tetratricopeptide (TPR) repeat protein
MMNGSAEKAEPIYAQLVDIDRYNLSAIEGLAWAQTTLGKAKQSKHMMQELLGQYPTHAPFHIQYAFALMRLRRTPEARYHYMLANRLTLNDQTIRQVSNQGLSWAHSVLGDYPNAVFHAKLANEASDVSYQAKKHLNLNTTFYYCQSASDKALAGVTQKVRSTNVEAKGSYEAFYIDKKQYRSRSSVSLRGFTRSFDLGVSAQLLDSSDDLYYPIQNLTTQIATRVYLEGISISPNFMLSYSKLPLFDVQQATFSPTIRFLDYETTYSLHYLYVDSDVPKADSQRFIQQFDVYKHLPMGFRTGVHYCHNDDSWLVSTAGSLNDNPFNNGDHWAVSILLSRTSL